MAKWLGHTQSMAMRHYVDVTDADFERAADGAIPKAAHNPAQHLHELGGMGAQSSNPAHEKTPVLQGYSAPCDLGFVLELSVAANCGCPRRTFTRRYSLQRSSKTKPSAQPFSGGQGTRTPNPLRGT